jgi:type II secretory pathway pseudopilin PulG
MMADENDPESGSAGRRYFGIYSQPDAGHAIGPGEVVAIVVSGLWLVLVGGFFLFAGWTSAPDTLSAVMIIVAIVLPIALIWVAAITLRTSREMREEAQRLQSALDAMRHAYINQAQAHVARPSMEQRLDEIVASARQTETAVATFATRREPTGMPAASPAAAPVRLQPEARIEEQPALALGTPADAGQAPLSTDEFIRALNFPDTPKDKAGFRALKRALDDHAAAKLIRAAQDALTLLSQDGIYMDDLKPDRARPELWRRFAQGERGRAIASLGGVRDRTSLALTAGRMRQDTIFRDAAHHFLRQFDRTFAEFEKIATDQDIVNLAETRTARAFMLFGRVAGIFA